MDGRKIIPEANAFYYVENNRILLFFNYEGTVILEAEEDSADVYTVYNKYGGWIGSASMSELIEYIIFINNTTG